MAQIKLVALDMDGTLLDDDLAVSAANREAITSALQKGVHVVLSTGRFITSAREYAESLGLKDYIVSSNGGEVWNEADELVERHVIPTAKVAWLRDVGKQHEVRYWGTTTDGFKHWPNFPEDIAAYDWLKVGFSTEDDRARQKVWDTLQAEGHFELTNSTPINIEVNPKGVNKATGLEMVCRRLSISMANVMAVGDSLNDRAMIKAAGCGVSMGNAQQQILDEADWVTGTNTEDGVAQAIHQWVL